MALLIKADGTRQEITPAGENGKLTYDQIVGLVTPDKGFIERITTDPKSAEGNSIVYLDEEGKLKQLPFNPKATEMSTYTAALDFLCGDVLFCTENEDMD